MPGKLRLVMLASVFFGVSPGTQAQGDQTATVNLVEENDSFGTTVDRHYTQGLRLSIASGESTGGTRASVADAVLLPGSQGAGRYRYAIFAGQSIFTPENLAATVPDSHDRPYAGWLYAGTTFYREFGRVLDRAEITFGVVGPAAQGEEVQNWWHDLTRKYLKHDRANGWGSQLHNEPGLILTEERKWRFAGNVGSAEIDLLPEVNASAGNVFTYAGAGFLARFGQRISVDWGPPRVQPAISGSDFISRERLGGRGYAWYFFAGTEGRLVARNIFLDGNSFEDSASVRKNPFVADYTAGVAMIFPHGRAMLSYVRRTEEFKEQDGDDQFLSITLAIAF